MRSYRSGQRASGIVRRAEQAKADQAAVSNSSELQTGSAVANATCHTARFVFTHQPKLRDQFGWACFSSGHKNRLNLNFEANATCHYSSEARFVFTHPPKLRDLIGGFNGEHKKLFTSLYPLDSLL